MNNQEIAEILHYVASCLEIQGEVIYKVLAYRKAADNIAALQEDICQSWQKGELDRIPGVGKAIAEKLDRLLSTGTFDLYERLKEDVPAGVVEFLRVPDIGPRKAAMFWKELGITSVVELYQAAQEKRLRLLPGMGAQAETRIRSSLEAYLHRLVGTRLPLGVAYNLAQEILAELRSVSGTQRVMAAGSLRRWCETVGDLDFVTSSESPDAVMERFATLPQVQAVLLRGSTKTSVRLRNGTQADLRVVEPQRWGTALQYLTGSRAHNIRFREIARRKGFSLSEYAITALDGGEEVKCSEESEVYTYLGLPYIPPELREDRGEFDTKLPVLIEQTDIQGDLHVRSTWADGQCSVAEMASAAADRGLRYITIADCLSSTDMAQYSLADRLHQQRTEVDEVNRQLGSALQILHGIEVEIRPDGTLGCSDEVLSGVDVVIAKVSTGLYADRSEATRSILQAIQNPHVDVIAYSAERIVGEPESTTLDYDAVFDAAACNHTIIEISAGPSIPHVNDVQARRALELGCVLAISSDARSQAEQGALCFGIAVARRAWAEAKDIANAWPLEKLLTWIQDHRTQHQDRQ